MAGPDMGLEDHVIVAGYGQAARQSKKLATRMVAGYSKYKSDRTRNLSKSAFNHHF